MLLERHHPRIVVQGFNGVDSDDVSHRLIALRMMDEISLISVLSSRFSASSRSRSRACIALVLVVLSAGLPHGSSSCCEIKAE